MKSKESQLSCGAPATDLKGRGVRDPNTVAGCCLHGGAHAVQEAPCLPASIIFLFSNRKHVCSGWFRFCPPTRQGRWLRLGGEQEAWEG